MDHKKIVVVEKDKILKSILELFTEQLGYNLLTSFLGFKESVEYIKNNEVDILIIDLNTFDNKVSLKDYIDLMETLDFPIVFIGNPEDINIAKEMIGFNIYSFMSKPITKDILKINIEIACSKHKKINYTEQKNATDTCSISCIVDLKGIVQDYNPQFKKLFLEKQSNIENNHLKDIFKYNQDFINFEKNYHKLSISESKSSLFSHKNYIYQANVGRNDDKHYKICFKLTLIEDKIFFENQYIKAKFNTLYANTSEAILIFDAQNELVSLNDNAQERYKRVIGEDLHTGISIYEVLKFIPKHELDSILETVYIPALHKLNRTLRKNGKDFNIKIQIAPIHSNELSSISGYIISSTEITKEIQLQKEVKMLKDELKPVYESTIQRFYLTDVNKKIVAFNQSAFKIIQEEYNHTLQKGDSVVQFVPKEIGEEKFEDAFQRVLQGEHLSFKAKIDSPIGEYWNEVHYEPIINENGELNRVLIWTLDITDSENNLIALNESNKRYELVARGGNDGLWDWDLRTNEVYLSPRWKSLLGYEDNEIENEYGIRDTLTHPEDKELSQKTLKECFSNGDDVFQNEIRLLCKDQSYKWVLERGIILRDENNKPYRMAGSITDITDRKESENALLKLNQSLLEERSMFITGNVGIIRVNAQDLTDVTYISDNCLEITGYTPLEFYNKKVPFKDLIHPEDRETHKTERENALNSNSNQIDFSHYRIIKKDGSIIWLKDFTTITRDKNGEIVDLLGYFIDITKGKIAEIELEHIQTMFSSVWQSLSTETFIVNRKGLILFSRNSKKYSIKQLQTKDIFIFDVYGNLKNWGDIQKKINIDTTVYTVNKQIDNTEYKITVSRVDQEKYLISTNIPLE